MVFEKAFRTFRGDLPIRDMYGKDLELHFEEFYLDEPKFDETTSKEKTLPMRPLRVRHVSSMFVPMRTCHKKSILAIFAYD